MTYETDTIDQWLSNDEHLYDRVLSMAQVAKEAAEEEDEEDAVCILADSLKELVEDMANSVLEAGGFVADLLKSSLEEIEYEELAREWLKVE
jgi:hypothetical protein